MTYQKPSAKCRIQQGRKHLLQPQEEAERPDLKRINIILNIGNQGICTYSGPTRDNRIRMI